VIPEDLAYPIIEPILPISSICAGALFICMLVTASSDLKSGRFRRTRKKKEGVAKSTQAEDTFQQEFSQVSGEGVIVNDEEPTCQAPG
jgi:hypothetical protein